MNKYELALVISARLDEETRVAVLEKAKAYITRFGGEVGETQEWGKRTLAYEIEKVTEGYYYFIQFEGPSDCPNELEKQMRIMDNVLRYLVVRKDENDTFTVSPEKAEEVGETEETAVTVDESEENAPEEAPKEESPEEESSEEAAEEPASDEAEAADTEE